MNENGSIERTVLVTRRLRYTERSCAVCGTAFLGWGRARFCSDPCRQRSTYLAHAEDRRAKQRARYHGKKQSYGEGTNGGI